MEEIQNIKKLKTAVIVLSVLLALSLAGLVAALLYNHFVQADMESVVVENNRIAAKEETVDSRDTTVSSTLSLRTTSAQRTTVSSLGAVPAFDTVTQLSTASSTSVPVEAPSPTQSNPQQTPSSCIKISPLTMYRSRQTICSRATQKQNITACASHTREM